MDGQPLEICSIRLFSFIAVSDGGEIRVSDIEIRRADFRSILKTADVTKEGLFLLLIARPINLAN
jgi:hypothetical protein